MQRDPNPYLSVARRFVLPRAVAACLCGLTAPLLAQTVTPESAEPVDETVGANEETIYLTPFMVTSEADTGYGVKDTLAGTRVRTELKDVASALSVVNEQFMENTGAKNSQDLLVYTTNTEVGGIHGNFSGAGGSQTYSESQNLLRPSNNTRVRGLDSADNTRDYFLTEIPWDGYNVDRVDMQRGPNSILFGVGSPAGIINTSVNGATLKNAGKVEARFDNNGSFRASLDLNKVLVKNKLSVRFSALDDNTKFQQKPAFNHDRRVFGALRYEPQLVKDGRTLFRVNYEKGDIKANRPRSLPPVDAITPWFVPGTDAYKVTPDGTKDWTKYTVPAVAPWYAYAAMGRSGNPNIGLYYDATTGQLIRAQSSTAGTGKGLDSTGAIDGTINGMQFGSNFALAGYNAYATQALPGGAFYGNKSISDPSIFDFYHNLMDGDNKREYQNWDASNVALSQTFFDDRFGLEAVYDYQSYEDGQIGFLNGGEYVLSVDINQKLLDGSDNPNLGRPYVGNSGQYGNTENYIDRNSARLTAFADVRTEDFFGKSLLSQILGHHMITGLLSQDIKETDYRGYARWASETSYAYDNQRPGSKADITTGIRQVDWIAYLGPSLLNAPSASGANVSRINGIIEPQSSQTFRYFDSTWNAPAGVNYDDPYTYVSYTNTDPDAGPIGGPVTNTGTQAENPANYVGWTTGTYHVLNADKGDIKSLYTSGQRSRNKIESQGLTWQGYFFDGAVVPVFGWRKDTVTNASSQAPKDPNTQVSLMDYELDTSDANTQKASGESKSYGIVIHTPKRFQEALPFGTHFSVFANKSKNFKADAPRGDVFGNVIENPKGETTDYGVVVTTLNDKLTLKLNWYETKVANATLTSDSAGFGSGNLYYAWALPYWGATHALAALDGIANPQLRQGSWGWPWNNIATLPDGSPDNARIGEIVRDFFTNFPLDQRFSDEYGLGLDVARMRSSNMSDWYAAVPNYGSGSIADGGDGASNLGLQPAYGGNLRSFGTGPVATGDTTSKGVEIELTAQPTKDWSVTFNASQTKSYRTSISPAIDEWIQNYTEFMAGDAGLITLWGGDTMRKNWEDHILAPYSVLLSQIGLAAPEVPEWRYNLISNYAFSEGALKGANVGIAYRWEDKRILGYAYDDDLGVLDVNQPYYGPTDDHFDLWIGYGRKITKDVYWRIQLNMRNVGEKNHLVPVNINPDGEVALSRIQDGMGWQITNTLSF